MKPLVRIAFVCEGDAEGDAFSGIAKSMVDHLRQIGHTVLPINVRVRQPWRALNAVRSFSRDRGRWQARFRYSAASFAARSALARRSLHELRGKVDAVLQIGATFASPTESNLPYFVYCDWNMALSIRSNRAHGLSESEASEINGRQSAIYGGAVAVFTICEKLRESFIVDYGMPGNRVVLAYAGANFDLAMIPPRVPNFGARRQPSVLFVGKDFKRKGGETLLQAFKLLKQRIPDARLVIVGVERVEDRQAGVEVLGLLRKSVPTEHARLLTAFAEADVFCLPSLHDPFPSVVREAMFFGLPCVTSDVWAFPEMVVDGQTGFTVPPGDAAALAHRLEQVLRDPILASQMGEAGRLRANELFQWSNSAQIISDYIERSHIVTV